MFYCFSRDFSTRKCAAELDLSPSVVCHFYFQLQTARARHVQFARSPFTCNPINSSFPVYK